MNFLGKKVNVKTFMHVKTINYKNATLLDTNLILLAYTIQDTYTGK